MNAFISRDSKDILKRNRNLEITSGFMNALAIITHLVVFDEYLILMIFFADWKTVQLFFDS